MSRTVFGGLRSAEASDQTHHRKDRTDNPEEVARHDSCFASDKGAYQSRQ